MHVKYKALMGIATAAVLVAAGVSVPAQAQQAPMAKPVVVDPLSFQPPAFLPDGRPTPEVKNPKPNTWQQGKFAPKGHADPRPATLHNAVQVKAAKSPVSVYRYAGMYEYRTVQGTNANFYPGSPYLDTTRDYHSLMEIAVEQQTSGVGTRDIVEIGYTVDPTVNGGSTDTHLFVGNWVDDVFGCYNGCGFVDYGANSVNAGTNVEALGWVLTSRNTAVQYDNPGGVPGQGAWWVAANGNWIGYFPESDWGGQTFSTGTRVQMFGEVVVQDDTAVTTDVKCSDMGSGQFASVGTTLTPNAARIASATYLNPSPAGTANMTPWATDSARWSVNMPAGTTRSIFVGGPGGNSTGGTPGAVGSC